MDTRDFPQRKTIRMKEFDYSRNGAYFVTICTHRRKPVFGDPFLHTPAADLCLDCMQHTLTHHEGVRIAAQVVMPDHYHAVLVFLRAPEEPDGMTLSDLIRDFKRKYVMEYKHMSEKHLVPSFSAPFWQRSFYEHIIRDYDEYRAYCRYIRENPAKWRQSQIHMQDF